jgi:uncharacterized protein DUF1488
MPLTRDTEEFFVLPDGVRFRMTDGSKLVSCRVSHEALQDHASRVNMTGNDAEIFEANRDLIEDVASDLYDAGAPHDDHGRLLVTTSALEAACR